MSPEIVRTFSPVRDSSSEETDFEYWFREGQGKRATWDDLTRLRLVAVLGEAGIGKTYEFKREVSALRAAGHYAFLVPLNQLSQLEDWVRALGDDSASYEKWKAGSEKVLLFLDAIDEARLTSPAALEKALSCARQVLQRDLERVSFYISCRITDWSIPKVREQVERLLALPSEEKETQESSLNTAGDSVTVEQPSVDLVSLSVYRLDPMSSEAAKRLAAHFGIVEVNDFWRQVEEGAFEFLATRPLDLEWMAALWKQAGRLGTYTELIEAAVSNRLVERNESYIEARAVLSSEQLRRGAEWLAAASVFSGIAYFLVSDGPAADAVVAPANVLPDWKPDERRRLLGSAIFDTATYGRIKFHHRAVREYLAAYWVLRQLDAGLPFQLAWKLFVQEPFDEEVLIPSRRPVLCWLAALDAKVRQRIVSQFPEMVMFEGDPQRWSASEVVEAFEDYLGRLKSGYRPNWWNDASEYRRVAGALPQSTLAEWLEKYRRDDFVLPKLLTLIKHGRVVTCEEKVYALYRDGEVSERLRRYALIALSSIASQRHRQAIAQDLVSGKLEDNERIAEAIEAVGMGNLSAADLAQCFSHTSSESDYGSGPMAMAIKRLLPEAKFCEAMKLLASLLEALPTSDVRELTRRQEAGEPREGWMFHVLPDVLLKALELAAQPDERSLYLLADGAVVVEKLRHTSYADNDDFRKLRAQIERFPELRRTIALRIATSSDIPHAISSLTWFSGVVHMVPADLDWLVGFANDGAIDSSIRAAWYQVARDISVLQLRGRSRQQKIAALVAGDNTGERSDDIAALRKQRIEGLHTNRRWRTEQLARKREIAARNVEHKAALLKKLDDIRAGTARELIRWLVVHAADRGGRSRYTKVDPHVVYQHFGDETGDAFRQGLAIAWKHIEAPDSTKYLDNSVPWDGLIGLASANHAFGTGLDVSTLLQSDVEKLVRLCVWELDRLEPWFEQLVESRLPDVITALVPWFEFEIALSSDGPIRRTIDMVLAGPEDLKQTMLRTAKSYIEDGRVPNERLRQRLAIELVKAGLVTADVFGQVASQALVAGFNATPAAFEKRWFREWAQMDLCAAWSWLSTNLSKWPERAEDLAKFVADTLGDGGELWKGLTGTEGEVRVMTELFRYIEQHLPTAEHSAEQDESNSSIRELWNRIPGILASLRGKSAHQALMELTGESQDTRYREWIASHALEQAAGEAEHRCGIAAADLCRYGEVFTRDPRTEAELFEQVMARLADIAEGVEKGPFSERRLFAVGMPEKLVQLWLAARLDDTPRRRFNARFSVTREPTVDADNRTDMEVSAAAGKVCIEIKPMDNTRGYSANSLADTLETQLVGQYLRGKNSRHGVLVLFRLDNKMWQLPSVTGAHDFSQLVEYLRDQARAVSERHAHVSRLEVLSIDCTQ